MTAYLLLNPSNGNCALRLQRAHGASIIDPTKVTRTALQNANSIAGLLLTTEAVVTEEPEPKGGSPAMPRGGGMGDMY